MEKIELYGLWSGGSIGGVGGCEEGLGFVLIFTKYPGNMIFLIWVCWIYGELSSTMSHTDVSNIKH